MALVVLPWMALGHLQPVPQAGSNDILPWDASGLAHAGEKVYAANGCVYCQHPAGAPGRIRRRYPARLGHGEERNRRQARRDHAPHLSARLPLAGPGFPRQQPLRRRPEQRRLPLPRRRRRSTVTSTIPTSSTRTAACPPTSSSSPRNASPRAGSDEALVLTGTDRPRARVRGRAQLRRRRRSSPTCFRSRRATTCPTSIPARSRCPPRRPRHERRDAPSINPALRYDPDPHRTTTQEDARRVPRAGPRRPPRRLRFHRACRKSLPRPRAHESLPVTWLYVLCGVALFFAGSSFAGIELGTGYYDTGMGAAVTSPETGPPVVAARDADGPRQAALQRQLRELSPGQRRRASPAPIRPSSVPNTCSVPRACSPPSCSTACRVRSW